jgi:hypothetical protein
MPELATIQTQPPSGTCPTAEELACYIDGTLSPEERTRVAEHLSSCESCFEVYSEVLQFQLESEPAPMGEVVPFPGERRRPPVPLWSSIAALLVVGVGVGGYFYLHLLAPLPELDTAKLLGPLQGKRTTELWFGVRTRGGSEESPEEPGIPMESAAFRIGVQIANLQAKLQANDVETVAGHVIPAALKAVEGQYWSTELKNDLGGVTSAIGNKTAPKDLLAKVPELAAEARYLDPLYFDLGQWVEAGRLAAISQDPAFFRQSETRSFLRRALWRDRLGFKDSKLPGGSRPDLDAIYQISGKSALQPSDFAQLQDHFKKILDANYPE